MTRIHGSLIDPKVGSRSRTGDVASESNEMAAAGTEVTGASLYEYMATAEGLQQWPSLTPIDCGAAPTYTSICSFTFPFAEYQEGGGVLTVPGLEAVSSLDYLP